MRYQLLILVILVQLILSFFSVLPSRAQATSTNKIGINVGQFDCAALIDLLALQSWWIPPGGWTQAWATATLSPAGYPTTGAATTTGIPIDGAPTSIYNFYGEGNFTLQGFNDNVLYNGSGKGVIPGTLVIGTAQNNWITTCQVYVTPASPPSDCIGYPDPAVQTLFSLSIVANDPSNPPNNFHLTRGDYPAWPATQNAPGYPFVKEYLAGLMPFSCIRSLGSFFNTNDQNVANVTTWASRPSSTYFGQNYACYENIIALCNLTGCDLWLNIPLAALTGTPAVWGATPTALAPTDWMPNMAQLLASKLNPGLHVYYEVDNEMWNYDNPNWGIVESLDQNNPAVAFLGTGGSWQKHGGEMAYLLNLAAQTMGPTLGYRSRPILSGQFLNIADYYVTGGLQYLASIGTPSELIYGTAGAPYMQLQSTDPWPTDLTDLFQSMTDNLNIFTIPGLRAQVALANSFGIKHVCCYECGQALPAQVGAVDWNTLIEPAQLDSRMGAIYTTDMQAMQNAGYDLCNQFTYEGSWSQWGLWGGVPSMWYLRNNQLTPRYQAVANFAAATACSVLPTNSLKRK